MSNWKRSGVNRATPACLGVSALLFAAFLPASAPVGASGLPSAVRQRIAAAYVHMDTAFGRRDIAGETSYCAPGYRIDDGSGFHRSLAQLRADQEQSLRGTLSATCHTRVLNLSPAGAYTVATIDQVASVTLVEMGGPVTTVVDEVSRDYWVHRQGRWLIARSFLLSSNISRRHVDPSGRRYSA
ncbi:MAG: hypothetical protein ACLQVD_00230 [Capsulimonadaceae bacterium]